MDENQNQQNNNYNYQNNPQNGNQYPQNNGYNNYPPQNNDYRPNKKGIGVVLGLFLGLIGLIIGLCLYKKNTRERDTFMSGWGIAFGISIGIIVIIFIAYIFLAGSIMNGYFDLAKDITNGLISR